MGITFTNYYGLTKVNNAGPEAQGWAVTDLNFNIISLLFKQFELHQHGGATPLAYPGYNYATPATPFRPFLTNISAAGVLSPGTVVGVRLAYLNSLGLETDASPETAVQLPALPARPNPLAVDSPISTPVPGAVPGGTYIYGLTRSKNGGETQLSDVTAVNVPFSSEGSFIISMEFDPINTYTGDGTDSLNIYRAQGYGSSFSYLTTITDGNQTNFIDVASTGNTEITPPIINQFDKNQQVEIDWSAICIPPPADASSLLVYISQTPGVYATNSLLASWSTNDAATPLPPNMIYYGTEILQPGWPKNFNQIPFNPSRINLESEVTGAPVLTKDMDFKGYQGKNLVLPTGIQNTTPIGGAIYFENTSATPAVRAFIGGSWQTLVQAGLSYTHPASEQGGHNASHILYPGPGGTTLDKVLDTIATPVANFRKQVSTVFRALATPVTYKTTSSVPTIMPDMSVSNVSPDFPGQMCEIIFNAHIQHNSGGRSANFMLNVNGSTIHETLRSTSFATPNQHTTMSIAYATPLTRSNNTISVSWWTGGGILSAIGDSTGGRRSFWAKKLY